MATQFKLRGDTAANWLTANPTLAQREPGVETDTNKLKIGDGLSAWADLPYIADPNGVASALAAKAPLTQTVDNKSAAYTILASDAGKIIRSTSATAVTFTIADVLSPGQSVDFLQHGAGQVTFAASGVTLVAVDNKLKLNKQYSGATITCVASGIYHIVGDLAA